MECKRAREKLIAEYIKPQGVKDEKVLSALLFVPRHEFVLPEFRNKAYLDVALPHDEGQTISQPSLVAIMTEALKLTGREKVLEIGTGSGYQAAVLSRVAKDVYTIEILEKLARTASALFKKLGYKNIHTKVGDGSKGWVEHAPFDAILVTAGAKDVPDALIRQLKEGGRMAIPVNRPLGGQNLLLGVKKDGKLKTEIVEQVSFVPLVSKAT